MTNKERALQVHADIDGGHTYIGFVAVRRIIEIALNEAEARGRKAGLEEAAKYVITGAGGFDMSYLEVAEGLRELAFHVSSTEGVEK